VKYAPNDAPYTGKGCWSWPLTLIEDQNTMEKIIKQGIQLQNDLSELKEANIDRATNNPQLLWESFKLEIKKITQCQSKKTYYKLTSKIRNLEKDRATLTTHPKFDKSDNLRMSKAIITSKLAHLEKAQAKNHKDTFQAKLLAQGEQLEGIWLKLEKS